jgi:hypothetical protein
MRARWALVVDGLCIVLFVVIGRRNHDEGSTIGDILHTAGPFLIALSFAWIGAYKQRRLAYSWRFGVPLWLSTVVFGLIFRRFVFHSGTALAFVIVATLFLGLVLVGWRAVVSFATTRRTESR